MKKSSNLCFNLLKSLFLLTICSISCYGQFSGSGSGTQPDPYIVTTPTELDEIRDDLNAWYNLGNDIDLTFDTSDPAGDFYNGGEGWNAIGVFLSEFNGIFNGQGFSINGLTINQPASDNHGLFGETTGPAFIIGLKLTNVDITCRNNSGGVVARNSATIDNVEVSGTIVGSGSQVGGIAGQNSGTINNSRSSCSVSGLNSIGGLVGGNFAYILTSASIGVNVQGSSFGVGGLAGVNTGASATISNSYSTGVVQSSFSRLGGLVGQNNASITESYSEAEVTNTNVNSQIGGLCGSNSGTISKSYATGNVSSNSSNVGGLVGENTSAISDSYSTGLISGSNTVGGFVGANLSGGSIENCYSISTSESASFFGFIGQNGGGSASNSYWDEQLTCADVSSGGTGKSSNELTLEATFVSWDFTNDWMIDEGTTYPYLIWQSTSASHNNPSEGVSPTLDIMNLPDLTGECSVTAPSNPPTATGNCGEAINGQADIVFPIDSQGETMITWTFEDEYGNTESQTQNVIISDVSLPVADQTSLSDLTAQCSLEIPAAPTATDNCDGQIEGTADLTFPIESQGETIVTWSYQDESGNVSTQTQKVIIEDTTPPEADLVSLADIISDTQVEMPTPPTATDNCEGLISATTSAVFPITEECTTVITWIYEDSNGNNSSQLQNIIISDKTAPVPDTDILDAVAGECSVSSISQPTATDACEGSITGVTSIDFPITTQGTTEITWTYTDSEGNESTQIQDVVINDTTAPVPDIAELADVTEVCELVALTAPTATDNCLGEIDGITETVFPVTDQGETTITWTFTDSNGNEVSQDQTVTIADNESPVPDLNDLVAIETDCDGAIAAATSPTATDNCIGSVIATTKQTFPFSPAEDSQILWEYDDGNGNISTQFQDVLIIATDEVTVDAMVCEGTDFTFPDGTVWTGQESQVSTLTNKLGCDSLVTTNITVSPLPAVDLGDDTVFGCVGEELTFSIDESSVNFTTYTISTLFGISSTDGPLTFVFDQTLASTAATQDVFVIIELTDENGCIGTDEVLLKDNSMVNWGIGAIENNDPSITVSNTILPETSDSFEWDFGDGNSNTIDVNPTHTYLENGEYTISLIVFNECGQESLSSFVMINGISEEKNEEQPLGLKNGKMMIYPNPTHRYVKFEIDKTLSVYVFALDGRMMKKAIIDKGESLDIGDLQTGQYMIHLLEADKMIFSGKIIKRN